MSDATITEIVAEMEPSSTELHRFWLEENFLNERYSAGVVEKVIGAFETWEMGGLAQGDLYPVWGYARHCSGNENATTPSGVDAPPIPEGHPVTEAFADMTELSRAWLSEYHTDGGGTITLYRSDEGGPYGGVGYDEGATPVMQSWCFTRSVADELAEKYGGEVYEATVPVDWVVFVPDLMWLDTHYAEATLAPPEPVESKVVSKA